MCFQSQFHTFFFSKILFVKLGYILLKWGKKGKKGLIFRYQEGMRVVMKKNGVVCIICCFVAFVFYFGTIYALSVKTLDAKNLLA